MTIERRHAIPVVRHEQMKTELATWSIGQLLEVRGYKTMLVVNDEYQRGDVWTESQQQMLIDSILRGFHLPLFYFRLKEINIESMRSDRLEVVDGQQRMLAIEKFCTTNMLLLDPCAANSRFPEHLRQEPCSWANRTYNALDPEDRARFDRAQLSIAKVKADDNEVRDLFIRLNSGSDLKPQERRDALPGHFCEFINDVGGRLYRTPEGEKLLKGGRPLFTELMKLRPMSDRGATREFVARLAILLFNYRRVGRFTEITQSSIDDFYHVHLNWDLNAQDASSMNESIEDIYVHLKDWEGPRLLKHEVIHTLFLWGELDGQYKSDWKSRFSECLARFKRQRLEANKTRNHAQPDPMWIDYGQFTSSNASKADSIQQRHEFFRNWMMRELKPQPLANSRVFPPHVKQQAWLEVDGVCAYSNQPELCQDANRIDFYEAEFHHIVPYSDGGSSTIDNIAVTHKTCNQNIGARHVPVINADGTRRDGAKVD